MAAAFQDASDFAGPRRFAAFLRLTPKQNSSGGLGRAQPAREFPLVHLAPAPNHWKNLFMADLNPSPPDHVDTVLRSIRQIHTEHGDSATRGQRVLNRAAVLVSRPTFLATTIVIIAMWIAVNLVLLSRGLRAFDPPPFQWLQGIMTTVSLGLVILLVGAQRHENQLTRNRDLLELELAMVGEQKIGKVIQLLEELRRDMPSVHNRTDTQADEMAQASDHRQVLDTLAKSADRAEE